MGWFQVRARDEGEDIVKSNVFWSNAKYIVSIICLVFEVIRYGDGDAPTLGEV